MIVADTCIWIDFLKKKEPVFSQFKQLLEDGKIMAFEPIFAELLQGARNKREREIIIGYWENLPKVEMNDLWIRAGIESSKNYWTTHGFGLIDAAIITHCRNAKASIWTVDKKLLAITEARERFS